MKVVFVTAGMGGGGTERVIANLSNYLSNKGHKISILMTAETEVAYSLDSQIDILNISEKTGGSIAKRIKRIITLRNYIKSDNEQIIVSFGTETNLFTIIASLFLKNKVIVSERNDPNQCSYSILRNVIYCCAKHFVFQTKDAKNCFSNRIQTHSEVIPNPIRDDLPAPYTGSRKKRIVAVGRLNHQKNHKLLIQAFQEFSKSYSDFELFIYGQGELEKDLKCIIKELKLEEKITLAGFSDNILEDIKDAYIYVLSSDFEGISNSLMEAMAIGLPVIATDCPIGGSAQLIQHESNGLLIPINNKEELINAMKRLALSQELALKLGKNAIKVREIYSSEKICEQWIEYICK